MKTLLLAAVLIAPPALAGAQQLQCPARYPAEVMQLGSVPKGWNGESQVRPNLLLDGGGFVSGPISGTSKGEMIGSGEIKTKEGFETRYPLDEKIKERWFYCSYGGVELFHRIAVEATQCVIKTKPRRGPANLEIRIICK